MNKTLRTTGLILLVVIIAAAFYLLGGARGGLGRYIQRHTKCNIQIAGRTGMATQNIYLQSNTTDFNGFYSVWRFRYDPSDYYFNPRDFGTLEEIQERCTFLVRKRPDSNSLIYTDWNVGGDYDYVYFVSQDDDDFSNAMRFK